MYLRSLLFELTGCLLQHQWACESCFTNPAELFVLKLPSCCLNSLYLLAQAHIQVSFSFRSALLLDMELVLHVKGEEPLLGSVYVWGGLYLFTHLHGYSENLQDAEI